MKRQVLLLIVIVAALLAGCSGRPKAVEIKLEASGLKYQPETLEVVAGQPVKLTFVNNDSVVHDFSIMEIPVVLVGATAEPMAGHDMGNMTTEPQLHVAAAANSTTSLEFTPSKSGTYEFFCTVPGHKETGMVGTLVVNGP